TSPALHDRMPKNSAKSQSPKAPDHPTPGLLPTPGKPSPLRPTRRSAEKGPPLNAQTAPALWRRCLRFPLPACQFVSAGSSQKVYPTRLQPQLRTKPEGRLLRFTSNFEPLTLNFT